MSETVTAPVVVPAPVLTHGDSLIGVTALAPMTVSGSVAPALGSMGIGAALGVAITYGFSLAHVTLPSDVSIAMVTLLSAAGHFLQDKYTKSS